MGSLQKKLSLWHFLVLASAAVAKLTAVDVTWVGTTSNWNTASNWSPAVVPNNIDDIARFTGNGNMAPTLGSSSITVGELHFTGGSYNITGTGTFTFSKSSGDAVLQITSSAGNQILNVQSDAIILNSSLDLTIASGNSLTASNFTGNGNVNVLSGSVVFELGSGAVPAGVLSISSGASVSGTVMNSPNLAFAGLTGSGLLDLTAGGLFNLTGLTGTNDFSGTITKGGISNISLSSNVGGVQILSGNNNIGGSGLTLGPGVQGADGPILSISSAENIGNLGALALFPEGGTVTLHVTGNTPFSYGSGSNTIILETIFGGTAIVDIDSSTALTVGGQIISMYGDPTMIFEKTGGGTLVLSGASTFDNPTQITGGRLNVTGSLVSPTTVFSGSTLGGNGAINAAVTVNSGGTISPGTSIGTLTVSSLTLSPGSITQIEISPSNTSLIAVTGAASINGSVSVLADAGSYGTSGSKTILTAGGGVSGSFVSATGNLPGYTFSIFEETNSVLLNYTFTGIPLTGLTGSAAKLANYLNKNVLYSQAVQDLVPFTDGTLQKALESVNPSRNAFAPFAVQNTLFAMNELVTRHLSDSRFFSAKKSSFGNVASLFETGSDLTADASGRMARRCKDKAGSFWIGGMGEYSHQNKLDQNPAFNFWSGGGVLGTDFSNGKNLFGVGAGAVYTHLVQDDLGGQAKIASYFVNFYDMVYDACYFPLYFEIAFWGVYTQIDNDRHISFPGFSEIASASFHSWELLPHLGLGYPTDVAPGYMFEPFGQFDLAVDWQQGFKEHGAGVYNMTHRSRNSQFLRSEGGFRIYKHKELSDGSALLTVKTSYVNKKAFGTGSVSASIVGTSALFNVETFRNTENLGSIGLDWHRIWGSAKPLTFSLAYNGEFSASYWSQEAMIRLTKNF